MMHYYRTWSTLLFLIGFKAYSGVAFVPSAVNQSRKSASQWPFRRTELFNEASSQHLDSVSVVFEPHMLTHQDVLWVLKPDKPFWQRLGLRVAATVIRLDYFIKRQKAPLILCPKGRAVLEAHYRAPGNWRRHKIAKFGITTERGPVVQQMKETLGDIYGLKDRENAGLAAIIYMFVEMKFRNMGVGEMALDVILAIHASQHCDFTVLVTDDNGSGKLISWYEANGFSKAPKLQDIMGSPGGKFGATMIAPTRQTLPPECKIKWW